MVELWLVIVLFVLSLSLLVAGIILRKKNQDLISVIVSFLSFIPFIVFFFLGWSFSPSYCALFCIITSACLFAYLLWKEIAVHYLSSLRWIILLGLPFLIVGTLIALPNIYIYAFQDDWLTRDCYITLGCTIAFAIGVIIFNHFHGKDIFSKIECDITETLLFAVSLLGILAGYWHTPLLPYGIGFAIMLISVFISGKKMNIPLSQILFWLGMGISVFYTLTPAIIL